MKVSSMTNFVEQSFERGQALLTQRSSKDRKAAGQFLTPPPLARFIARQVLPIPANSRILEPAVGSGVLVCALIEALIGTGAGGPYEIVAYEVDRDLAAIAHETVGAAVADAALHGLMIDFVLHQADFVAAGLAMLRPSVNGPRAAAQPFTIAIGNPPYFKISKDGPHAAAIQHQVAGYHNAYSLFMMLTNEWLVADGRGCFVMPRSFCSGAYFNKFRHYLVEHSAPVAVHVFESRRDTFADVLQENIVWTWQAHRPHFDRVRISHSYDATDLDQPPPPIDVEREHFLAHSHQEIFFRLPTDDEDLHIIERVNGWGASFGKLKYRVSTGPVVPFRATAFLADETGPDRVPLLWMHHVQPQRVLWPRLNLDKPQWIKHDALQKRLLLPNVNRVLVRRFSTKEEPRRLVAAPYLASQFPDDEWIGLENHLNYIQRLDAPLSDAEAIGLAALLNSRWLDRYFRVLNGHTQVNATELQAMPLPPRVVLCAIGEAVATFSADALSLDDIADTVEQVLAELVPISAPQLQLGW